MIKVYKYDTRVIVHINGKNYSYSYKRYGNLLQMVINQTLLYKKKIFNPFIIIGDVVILYYWEQKEQKIYNIFIDLEDYYKIKNYYWSLTADGYVHSRTNGSVTILHRFLMNTPEYLQVDHINRNPIDNRKVNLRNVKPYINARNKKISSKNTSGYQGVDYQKKENRWRARWATSPNTYKQKTFKTKKEAIEYRKFKEKEYNYL